MFKEDKDGTWCPLVKKDCVEKKCAWYMHIRGMDPNTGKDVDHWGCAVSWMPMLLIENSQQQRSTGSAVESFRNEMVKSHESNQQISTQQGGGLPDHGRILCNHAGADCGGN